LLTKILIFVVLKQWLLNAEKLKPVLLYNVTEAEPSAGRDGRVSADESVLDDLCE